MKMNNLKFKEFMQLAPVTESMNVDSKLQTPSSTSSFCYIFIMSLHSTLSFQNTTVPSPSLKKKKKIPSRRHLSLTTTLIFLIFSQSMYLLNVFPLLHVLCCVLDQVLLCAPVCFLFSSSCT